MRAKYKLRHLSNAIVGYLKKVQIKQSKFYAISLFYVYELGPSTKILFPMAVFLPRLMVLKVSMHENAREKRVASIEPLETTDFYTNVGNNVIYQQD